MSDHDFTLTILDLMPNDDGWREFLSVLAAKFGTPKTSDAPSTL
jgi:hypothetical protein